MNKNCIKIHGEIYQVEISSRKYPYAPNQPALEISLLEDGMPSGVITVSIPEAVLEDGETIIKSTDGVDYVPQLVDAGIAEFNGRYVPSGYAMYPVVKLTEEFMSANTY